MPDFVYRMVRYLALVLVYLRPYKEAAQPVRLPTEYAPPRSIATPRPKPRRARTPRPRFDMRLKTSILDQLEDNTKIIGRMKAFFPSEYGLYSQIGAVIVPHDEAFVRVSELMTEPISPWFNKVRPSFGAVVTGTPRDERKGADDLLAPRLTHFRKVERPSDIREHMFGRHRSTIQPIALSSNLYIFTLYYDERDWARLFPRKSRRDWQMCKFFERAFAVELPIELTKDGEARPLKIIRENRLPRAVTKRDSYKDASRTVTKWDYPYTKDWLKETRSGYCYTPVGYIRSEVGFALRCYEEATASMIQVRASKNGVCTLVNVNVEHTPGFFDDRDDVIIEGVKKRIFHVVRAHARVGSKGVRIHFRGLRQFVWNGYAIEISVPGRDHLDTREIDIAASIDDVDEREGVEMGDLAKWLVAIQHARAGAMVGKRGELPPPPRLS